MKLGILGDLHFKIDPLLDAVSKCNYTVQLGDLGYTETYLQIEAHPKISAQNFGLVAGNHDDYTYLLEEKPEWYLGDFGYIPGTKIGFCRGAFSVDRNVLHPEDGFWLEEELSYPQLEAFISWFEEEKPSIMISHDAPANVVQQLHSGETLRNSKTVHSLFHAWQTHQPDQWFFGHHHMDWAKKIGRTQFRCLNSGSLFVMDI